MENMGVLPFSNKPQTSNATNTYDDLPLSIGIALSINGFTGLFLNSTPKQMETWSDLMPLMTWQLWLARDVVQDSPWPRQKPMTKLPLGRIANSFAPLLGEDWFTCSSPKTSR
jgi:hypothetical protein